MHGLANIIGNTLNSPCVGDQTIFHKKTPAVSQFFRSDFLYVINTAMHAIRSHKCETHKYMYTTSLL